MWSSQIPLVLGRTVQGASKDRRLAPCLLLCGCGLGSMQRYAGFTFFGPKPELRELRAQSWFRALAGDSHVVQPGNWHFRSISEAASLQN